MKSRPLGRADSLCRMIALVGVLMVVVACSTAPSAPKTAAVLDAPPKVPGAAPGQTAKQYLDTALDVIQAQDVFSPTGDWPVLRRQADTAFERSPSLSQAHREIQWVLKQLGYDGHAAILAPAQSGQVAADQRTPSRLVTVPTGRLLEGDVGYLNLPSVTAAAGTAAARKYAEAGLDVIAALNSRGARSWIVDLRSDTGGDMYPMLMVVGPLLSQGRAIGFRSIGGPVSWVTYDGFAYSVDGQIVMKAPKQVSVSRPAPPVAVLIGFQTASAGEAVAITFIGRPHTETFGQPTAGATSSPTRYTLSDGAVLQFAKYLDVNPAGTVFQGPINPDHSPSILPGDATVEDARRFLLAIKP